jgi:hypothetical protein
MQEAGGIEMPPSDVFLGRELAWGLPDSFARAGISSLARNSGALETVFLSWNGQYIVVGNILIS